MHILYKIARPYSSDSGAITSGPNVYPRRKMVVTKVPTVSFVELKCLRMSRVAAALMVEPIGLEGVRMLGWWEVSHLREQGHGRDDDYLHRFLS